MLDRTALALFLTALAATATPAGSTRELLEARVSQGESLTRRFEERTRWLLEDVEMRMDDAEVSMDLPSATGSAVRVLEVVDEHLRCDEDGALLQLRRSFEEVSSATDFEAEEAGSSFTFETRSASPLEGEVVRFTRGDEGWEPECEQLADDVLEDLDALLDLRFLLPEEAVDAGDEWELDAADLRTLLRAGGDLSLSPVEATKGSAMTIPTPVIATSALGSLGLALGDVEGDFTATLVGATEDELQPRVELRLEFDAGSTRDAAEVLAAYLIDLDEEALAETAELTLTMDLQGTGKLIWDLAEGRAVRLDLEAELAFEAEVGWDEALFGEQTTAFYARYELSGETGYRVTFE